MNQSKHASVEFDVNLICLVEDLRERGQRHQWAYLLFLGKQIRIWKFIEFLLKFQDQVNGEVNEFHLRDNF